MTVSTDCEVCGSACCEGSWELHLPSAWRWIENLRSVATSPNARLPWWSCIASPALTCDPQMAQKGSLNSETCETGSLVSALLTIVTLNYIQRHKFNSLSTHFSSTQHIQCLLDMSPAVSRHLMPSPYVSCRLNTFNAFSTCLQPSQDTECLLNTFHVVCRCSLRLFTQL